MGLGYIKVENIKLLFLKENNDMLIILIEFYYKLI